MPIDLTTVLRAVSDALYHLRQAKEQKGRKPPEVKFLLDYATPLLERALRAADIDPGVSAADADRLQLSLKPMGSPEVVHLEVPVEGSLEALLQQAMERSGNHDIFKELGRFHEFCSRATYCGTTVYPDGQTVGPLMDDDPDLPVYDWIRQEGRGDWSTLTAAARLYQQWQDEKLSGFEKKMGWDRWWKA